LSFITKFFIGYKLNRMSNLTRDVLVKNIVATELKCINGQEYIEVLKSTYHKWEHVSSEELCDRYNKIHSTNITVDSLVP